MSSKNPYDVIKSRYITEKATMLGNLKNAQSNASVRKCESPKYVFLVDPRANKFEIKNALETMYASKNIKVVAVNTVNVKPKHFERRGARRAGRTTHQKKAIVTLQRGDTLED
jgi:large subunit ribosomal protein L23